LRKCFKKLARDECAEKLGRPQGFSAALPFLISLAAAFHSVRGAIGGALWPFTQRAA
jgi:hypothetical protein